MIIAFPNICVVVYNLQGFHGALFYFHSTPALCARQGQYCSCLQIGKHALSQMGLFASASQEGRLQQEACRCEQRPLGTIPWPMTVLAPAPAAPKSPSSGSPSLCPHLSRSDDLEVTLGSFSYTVLYLIQSRVPDSCLRSKYG